MSRPDHDRLTTTSYAVLAQVAVRPWSTYELVQQRVRYFRYVWPRAESAIYREVKRLSAMGLLADEKQYTGKRARTVYSITDRGRDELAQWLATPVAPFSMDFEAMLRLFIAPLGTKDQLVSTLEQVRTDAREMLRFGGEVKQEFLDGIATTQQQVYLRALAVDFFISLLNTVDAWAARTLQEIEPWEDLTPDGKNARGLEMMRELPVATPEASMHAVAVPPRSQAQGRRLRAAGCHPDAERDLCYARTMPDMLTNDNIMAALGQVKDPEIGRDLVSLGMVKNIEITGDVVDLTVELTTPACPLKAKIESDIVDGLAALGATTVRVDWASNVKRSFGGPAADLIPGVKNTIAVASGKGGVGKTTVAVNLAVSLARDGARVGLLDGDITGPNVPLMMGTTGAHVTGKDGRVNPVVAHGVKMMSIQYFLTGDAPVIWRGPLIHSAIQQFLRDVEWGELDYLVVDLPPGTGDAALSLSQLIPLTGAVVVTTPQEVSLADARKAIAMFNKVNVRTLGVVENMSGFICPNCREEHDIFGSGGGEKIARELELDVLGRVPLEPGVRTGGDAGVPITSPQYPGAQGSVAAEALRELARTVAGRVSVVAAPFAGAVA